MDNSKNKNNQQETSSEFNVKKVTPKKNLKKKKPKRKVKRKSKNSKVVKKTLLGILVFLIIVCSAVLGIGLGVFTKIINSVPSLDLIAIEPNIYTSIVYDKDNKEIDRFHGKENREYVSLQEIPENLQDAIVAVEDERFYNHFGIDIRGILRAAFTTIKNKLTNSSGVEGASTITQQLIKNNVTKVTRNSIKTKLQEQYLAVNYEKELKKKLGSKEKAKKYILELYLNTIALGHGYNGVQTAALGYFNKDSSELTLAECTAIAAITNNPSMYSPRSKPESNQKRQQRILKKMLEQNMITQTEYDEAINEDIYSKISSSSSVKKVEGTVIHSYFVDSLFDQVSKDLQDKYKISNQQANNLIYNGGLQIYSSMDKNAQDIMDKTFLNNEFFPNVPYKIDVTYKVSVLNSETEKQEHSEYKKFVKTKEAAEEFINEKRAEIEKGLSPNESILAEKSNLSVQPQASMVIMDYKQGLVVALTGGRDVKELNRGFNRATDAIRQPGSVFKVLAAFAPGLDTGVLTPATVIDDVPFQKGDYAPNNWYSGYRGLSTVREAIRDSMNIVSVKALDMVGVQAAYNYLLNFGFTTLEDDMHLAIALGGLTNGVTQLEVTAAFAAIANQGKYYAPKFYTKVLDHDGNILLDLEERTSTQVLKDSTSFLLTNMMEDVVTSGTGGRAKFKSIKMPIAGKTGTTQETKDLTFVGYTPYYVSGIWTGYDRYDKVVPNMQKILKTETYHLEIWRNIMEQIHKNLEYKTFPVPTDVTTALICIESGNLATDLCEKDPRGSRVRKEYFAKGTAPTEYCKVHVEANVCTVSNKLAGTFCPEDTVVKKVGIVRPIPYTGSATIADKQYEVALPNEVCDVHLEGDIIVNPDSTSDETSSDSESTTNLDIIGNIVPSTPEETQQVTETQTESTTKAHVLEEIIVNDPVIN